MISVAIVEDIKDIRESLYLIINESKDLHCIGIYPDAETAIPELLREKPSVILMDISLPGMSGIEAVAKLRAQLLNIDIIILTVHFDDLSVFNSLKAGACGYLTKDTPPKRILEAIREAKRGGAPMSSHIARMIVNSFKQFSLPSPALTSRESQVLKELCGGKSYKMIANSLFISEDTVRHHLKNIYRKLEVNSKSEAVIKALKNNWV